LRLSLFATFSLDKRGLSEYFIYLCPSLKMRKV
jgi:hypothetical protein